MYAESDYASTIDYARKETEEHTLPRRNAEIATAMLADGVDIAIICKYTRLSHNPHNYRL